MVKCHNSVAYLLAGLFSIGPIAAPAQTFSTLFSFDGIHGANPYAGVTLSDGVLYGVTYNGGSAGDGVVYALSRAGRETVLHSFMGGSDGANPYGDLLAADGKLYGTTVGGGGSRNFGTLFSITPAGAETVLHRFTGGADGSRPFAGPTALGDALYVPTFAGGAAAHAGVVEVALNSGVTVNYAFMGSPDAARAYGPLTAVGSSLFGTTFFGGQSNRGSIYGITSNGSERVVYSFDGTQGALPRSGLNYFDGNLYGTASVGGSKNLGVIFEITPAGTLTVLHNFMGYIFHDGSHPESGLTYADGAFYGTAVNGGTSAGGGIVYKLTAAGDYTVVYTFSGGSDGSHPYGDLAYYQGSLYGTTFSGGSHGLGSVFKIQLSPAPEPATWSSMLLGFGLVGVVSRRRRTRRQSPRDSRPHAA